MSAKLAFHKGKTQDFFVFLESEELAQKYIKDSTLPLVDVVGTFKVYTSEGGRGVDGVISEAAKRDLENEFGKKTKDEIIEHILREGSIRNDSKIGKKFVGVNGAKSVGR